MIASGVYFLRNPASHQLRAGCWRYRLAARPVSLRRGGDPIEKRLPHCLRPGFVEAIAHHIQPASVSLRENVIFPPQCGLNSRSA